MRERVKRLRWLFVIAVLVLTLAGCRADCVECSSLRPDPSPPVAPSSLGFQLCVSQVPDPEVTERGCGAVDVEYVVVQP
jgi:hypothetical protein